jgi:hypothetical protein
MEVDFDNLDNHIIPLDEFPLSWRFTDEGCNILSSEYISQFKFLDVDASKFLSDYLVKKQIHKDFSFKHDLFNKISKFSIKEENHEETKKWLFDLDISINTEVFLSWESTVAIAIPF